MKYKSTKLFATIVFLMVSVCTFAQQGPDNEKEQQKQMDEMIEKQLERYTDLLDLEDWQIFYLDSIYHHDYTALRDELAQMSKARVGNVDLYQQVQDKWFEKMYCSIRKVLGDEQWAKYLKTGAEKEKKARDKRAAKLNKQN